MGFSSMGWAQSADLDVRDSQYDALQRIIQATGQVIFGETLTGEPVTYSEILRDPDNIELNLRFARGQM